MRIAKTTLLLLCLMLTAMLSVAQICSGTMNVVWEDNFGAGVPQIALQPNPNITAGYFYGNFGVNPGNYTIVNKYNYFGSWHVINEDHTPTDSNGYFLVIDGNAAAPIFYDVYVDHLCPFTQYSFSTYAMNIDLPAFPSNQTFTFIISDTLGNQISTWSSPPVSATASPIWNWMGFNFSSGNNTKLRLQVKFNETGYDDFAFDDFQFSICGPTLSISTTAVNNVCTDSIPLIGNLGSGYINPIYQWKKRNASGVMELIPGANSSNYTDYNLTDTNFYSLTIGDGSLACPIIATKEVIIQTAIRTTLNQTICSGASFEGYTNSGIYRDTFALAGGCDSIRILQLTVLPPATDFSFKQNICNPLEVQFFSSDPTVTNITWLFGDGNQATGVVDPIHTYSGYGSYSVKFITPGGCTDTLTKVTLINVANVDMITTRDTVLCNYRNGFQILAKPSLNFCWTPVTFLDNPTAVNPISTPTQSITYYLNAATLGNNLIVNGDFAAGNTGFISNYNYVSSNTTEAEYFVGITPQTWNTSFGSCSDHSISDDQMMLVNGSPTANAIVWKQNVAVVPNQNYAFVTWIQSLYPQNPAQLLFTINGEPLSTQIAAPSATCTWLQYYATWNSGNQNVAEIAIVNNNTQVMGNDFALDDINFAEIVMVRDSIHIEIDTVQMRAMPDTSICKGTSIQLTALSNVTNYSWSPAATLNNPNISNPTATPSDTTWYTVNGQTINGCTVIDSVRVAVVPAPLISTSTDTAICKNTAIMLQAFGADLYTWSPAATLSAYDIPNPIANPTGTTTYYVSGTSGGFTCAGLDSIVIKIKSINDFSVSGSDTVCSKSGIQLQAQGGNIYSWSPAGQFNDATIPNPIAYPVNNTVYTVKIKDSVCNDSARLSIPVYTKPLPQLIITKSNDIDCYDLNAKLLVTGANRYQWFTNEQPIYLTDSTIPNPIAFPSITRKYYVTGLDTISGCANTDSIIVFTLLSGIPPFDAPNSFSPNNDGLNDCWRVFPKGRLKYFEMAVYNRWGNQVFFTTDVTKCWDGTYKGQPQDPGNFVFYIKASNECISNVSNGNLLLLR